jgi:hypothetical protein
MKAKGFVTKLLEKPTSKVEAHTTTKLIIGPAALSSLHVCSPAYIQNSVHKARIIIHGLYFF